MSYRLKLILAISAVSIAGLSLFIFNRINLIRNILDERIHRRMDSMGKILAEEIADHFRDNDMLQLKVSLDLVHELPTVDFISVADSSNLVLFSSETQLENKKNIHHDNLEISWKKGAEQLIKSYPFKIDRDRKCYIQIGFSTRNTKKDLQKAFWTSVQFGIAAALAIILVAWFISGILLSPLKEMKNTTDKIAAGDFSRRVKLKKTNDLIGMLGTGLNNMAVQIEDFTNNLNRKIVTATRDLTETNRQLLEKTELLEASNKKLLELATIKSKFLSMVSHELRTPLTVIKEGINIVLDGSTGALNEDQKDFLSTAQKNVDRLHRLINDVLDFSKLESGKMQYNMEDMDINKLIEETAVSQKIVISNKGISLKVELDDSIGKVKIDADKIVQVINNLISNAINFTLTGLITVKSVLNREKKEVEIHVIDTGVGIKKEDLPKLFATFQQVGEDRYRKPGSTGLGLAICREIILGHGGRIWAGSEHGKGSEFVFTLPVFSKNNNAG